MKLNNFSKLFLFAAVVLFAATSCVKEGPMGLSGADGTNGTNGTDGADGTVSCLVCHSGTNMDQKKSEFAMSEHSVGAIAVDYAGGRAGCAQCHSNQGFVAYATLGIKDQAVANPGAWECSTCHGLHQTFTATDYALRLGAAAVQSNIDAAYKFDFKNSSNLCVNCHQARTAEPSKASAAGATTFKITNTHYGPHHGPQGNVVAGVGFAEIPGSVAYPAAGTSKHFASSCTGCHMSAFNSSKKQGGHSLVPSINACNTCHSATDTNYNHGGLQSEVAGLLLQLRDKLVALGVVAYSDVDAAYEPVVGTYPMVQAQAYYNWIGLTEDRSEGVHNPVYVRALLINTLEALNK